MRSIRICKLLWIFLLTCGMTPIVFAEPVDDPCGGESALLNLVDRPTIGDTACVLPFKKMILELGFQYQKLKQSGAYQQNIPEAEFRVGLPANNELVFILPNYYHQTITPHSGFGATTVGIKHQIVYTKRWLAAVESIVTLPSGSAAFGSQGAGVVLNGVVDYTFNPTWSVTVMLGVSSQTQSKIEGGQRYASVNPDLVITYVLNPKVNFYGEIYAQSKTGPGEGRGYNFDGGILYLPLSYLEVDLEVGQRMSGQLGTFSHYVGAGMAIEM